MEKVKKEILKTSLGNIIYEKVPSNKIDYTKKNVYVVSDTAKRISGEYYKKFSPEEHNIAQNHYYFVYFTEGEPSSKLELEIIGNHPFRY